MTLDQALEIVLDLATENLLDPRDAGSDTALLIEACRQVVALEIVVKLQEIAKTGEKLKTEE